ncbi:hypothetical protein SERLADRAFT_451461 [Serpula lacrymans var. lacrymans S7.9]|uniref:Uncharacterized protein n=1 Tax=Serpula lacrymans var. lacrymans (strain S7.9) TaxID=578457 RepID=F8P3A2_SERL9|nr:uncharacterized protein SERLADRAFT_451461 [Serpula lacrymans var. lacrymans S7.9]EGO22633.1 hypothetical protein SERLADRAFT_451461 [Serpula lacrymans var. lacrymans S7.9]
MAVQISLRNGERVKINDHVYCSPSWSVRDGTPYSVARIMEFLPPEGTLKGKGKGKENYTRVRLAWYYRPSDVSDRPVADSRLLLAAIYSEVCDINQLRSKCHVIHRDKISDLAGWKKRPDRFYFTRLFDPYIKKEYEVIQSSDVRNLPENIRQVLIQRYEYVVAEKDVVPDLTDSLRLCQTCSEWCPNPETVRCDRCKKFFHMGCVQPPLLAKPSRGYGWTCAPCSKKHEEEVDSHEVRHPTPVTKPKSNAPAPRGRGRPRKDRTLAEKEENLEIKHFKLWPFRYFGQYTVAEDTLDPDDLIFPRAATRVGPKFQVNIPSPPTSDVVKPPPTTETQNPDPDERGGDSTIEVLSLVNSMTREEGAHLEEWKSALTRRRELLSSVDWLTEVIRRFSQAYSANRGWSTVDMSSPMRSEKWKKSETRYTDREWTAEEVAAFEDGILTNGAELRAVREEIGTRPMPEVVRFYGHWKNLKLGEENVRIKAAGTPNGDDASHSSRATPISDDEGSIVRNPPKANSICGACRTRESDIWWKAPKGLATDILCDNCGTNWRKYADLNVRPVREDVLSSAKSKREGTPLNGPTAKRTKTSTISTQSPPPNTAAAPQLRCLACQKNGPVGKVLKCQGCHFRVHAGACGVAIDKNTVDSWTCDLCQNAKTLEASLNTQCVLCPRRKASKKPAADSFMRACKPTEGQGWVHVLCSVFTPEVTFTDVSRLRLVEGISTIPRQRWSTKCTLCGEISGAVLRCSDCVREFHASCAWKAGHKFGFEIQPVRNHRRDVVITTFKGDTGAMAPVVCCREHENSKRHLYDICETNEMGESALQLYCQTYKQAPVSQAHGLLRKARRLDQILNIRSDSLTSSGDPSDRECLRCHTQYSPCFYPSVPGLSNDWICHRCHFDTKPAIPELMLPAISRSPVEMDKAFTSDDWSPPTWAT